jgi:hypothetical protein
MRPSSRFCTGHRCRWCVSVSGVVRRLGYLFGYFRQWITRPRADGRMMAAVGSPHRRVDAVTIAPA